METVKKCCACGEFKALSEFSSNRSRVDGKIPRCILCHRAYQKEYRKTYKRKKHNVTNPSMHGTKLCHRCNQVLDYSQFNREETNKDGYAFECKTCHYARSEASRKRPRSLEQRQNDCANRRVNNRRTRLKRISSDSSEYDSVFAQQNGRCAICGEVETAKNQHGTKSLALDHCHVTNTFRGLLCQRCNVGLGYFRDSPELLAKAIAYLTKPVDVMRSCEATSVD